MITHNRNVGDTLTPFPIQIRRDGYPVNLTDATVHFKMVAEDGSTVIAETDTGVNITDAAEGWVDFDFPAPSVAAGLANARGYFTVEEDGEQETFPSEGILINIIDHAANLVVNEADITPLQIADLARAPRRTRTVEGTVEERSVNELIAADRYLAQQAALDAVPWGIRIAKVKPPSSLG